MWKKGHRRKNWTERWFVLKPNIISYYVSEDLRDKRGDIVVDDNCSVEVKRICNSVFLEDLLFISREWIPGLYFFFIVSIFMLIVIQNTSNTVCVHCKQMCTYSVDANFLLVPPAPLIPVERT